MNFTDLRIMKTQERLQNALLELLETKELKAITVKEICDRAGISRNAFYQHYGYKEDLYEQMAVMATDKIRNALTPLTPDHSKIQKDTIDSYARQIIRGISEVKELLQVMLRKDDGILLKQLSDLIFNKMLNDAIPYFDLQDSQEMRLYYEYVSAGMAAYIIRWILDTDLSDEQAASLLANILQQTPADRPVNIMELENAH